MSSRTSRVAKLLKAMQGYDPKNFDSYGGDLSETAPTPELGACRLPEDVPEPKNTSKARPTNKKSDARGGRDEGEH